MRAPTWMALLLAISALVVPSPARAEPSDRTLVYTGLALIPPTYLLGVSLHEGSHALAAKLVGAEVLDVHLFPPGRDPRADKFRFGWTYVRGLRTKRDRALFYLAPKITDVALLGGFAGLVFTGAWPDNRYGQLALTVVATGLWVDFAKDVVLFSDKNDVVKAENLWCMTGWKRLPARLVYAGAIVGLGFVVAHGFRRTFGEPDDPVATTRALPIFTAAF
ncbi:MAG: hypothetical protein ACTHU0_10655 [Kofleriaceae bacterium]